MGSSKAAVATLASARQEGVGELRRKLRPEYIPLGIGGDEDAKLNSRKVWSKQLKKEKSLSNP